MVEAKRFLLTAMAFVLAIQASGFAQQGQVAEAPPARFVLDKWVYFQSVTEPGTPSERRSGTLRYDGKDIDASDLYDYVQTPWGTMYWWGQEGKEAKGGWLLSKPQADKIGRQIRPEGKTTGSDEVDLAKTATYARKQWRYEYERTVLPSGATQGRGALYFADKKVQAGSLRDYVRTPWGVMYNWGDEKENAGAGYRGWVPKIAIGRPGRLVHVAAEKVENLNLGQSGVYESGQWQYSYDIQAKGTRSESRRGRLSFQGGQVKTDQVGNYVRTPWGVLFWWGNREHRWGNHGWLPMVPGARTGKLIDPSDGLERIDLAEPRAYEKDGWSFIYTVWARGEETQGSAGQLYYKDKKVQAKQVGDFVQSPWGTMYYHGPLGVDLKGPHGWLPVPVEDVKGNPLDPASGPVQELDLTNPATYTVGKWRLAYTIWRPGSAGQGRLGQLTYDGQALDAKSPGDAVETPWGTLWWWGALNDELRGDYGWLPIRPTRASQEPIEPPDPTGLDLTEPKTFEKGQWKYVYLVWARRTPRQGRSGRLYFASAEVKAERVGDYVETPWGKMYYWGVPTHAHGNQGWLPVEKSSESGRKIIVTQAREKIDLSVPATYRFSDWRYVYAVWAPGTRSEGSVGQLFYRGRSVEPGGPGDWVDSPWGKLYYHGAMEDTFGQHGWIPVATEKEGKQLQPILIVEQESPGDGGQ